MCCQGQLPNIHYTQVATISPISTSDLIFKHRKFNFVERSDFIFKSACQCFLDLNVPSADGSSRVLISYSSNI